MTSLTRALRICHLADIHLGFRRYARVTDSGLNQREVDVNAAFRESIDRIIRVRPDIVLIAGDLFHAVRPSNLVLTFAFREIRRLAESIRAPIVIIAGNHEVPRRVDSGSILRLFSEIPGVYVAEFKAERFNFSELNLSVLCLPHPSLLSLDSVAVRAEDSCKYNILVTHAQTNERWVSDFGGVDVALSKLNPHEWDYIALGHVHLYREIGLNAAYPGSIEYTSTNIWMEASEQKGFLEVELPSKKRTFHALTSPREVIVLDSIDCTTKEPADVTESINAALGVVPGGVEGKIIRLELKNISRHVFRQVDHKEIRKWRHAALNLSLEVRTEELPALSTGILGGRGASIERELEKFCTEWRSESLMRDDVKSLLSELWRKVNKLSDEAESPGQNQAVNQ